MPHNGINRGIFSYKHNTPNSIMSCKDLQSKSLVNLFWKLILPYKTIMLSESKCSNTIGKYWVIHYCLPSLYKLLLYLLHVGYWHVRVTDQFWKCSWRNLYSLINFLWRNISIHYVRYYVVIRSTSTKAKKLYD